MATDDRTTRAEDLAYEAALSSPGSARHAAYIYCWSVIRAILIARIALLNLVGFLCPQHDALIADHSITRSKVGLMTIQRTQAGSVWLFTTVLGVSHFTSRVESRGSQKGQVVAWFESIEKEVLVIRPGWPRKWPPKQR
jgi:hypothetical protein